LILPNCRAGSRLGSKIGSSSTSPCVIFVGSGTAISSFAFALPLLFSGGGGGVCFLDRRRRQSHSCPIQPRFVSTEKYLGDLVRLVLPARISGDSPPPLFSCPMDPLWKLLLANIRGLCCAPQVPIGTGWYQLDSGQKF